MMPGGGSMNYREVSCDRKASKDESMRLRFGIVSRYGFGDNYG